MELTELIKFFDYYFETFKYVSLLGCCLCLYGLWISIVLLVHGAWFGKVLAFGGIIVCLGIPLMDFILLDEIKAYRASKTCVFIDSYRLNDIETENTLPPTI
jgi:hypothetical protein